MQRSSQHIQNGLRQFMRAQDGAVLTYVAVSLAVMMGFLALIFDFGRLATTQSELQSFVDNVALSAAGELDAADDAITRATAAAEQMIADSHSFGQGDNLLEGSSDFSLLFYENNPNGPQAGPPTNNPRNAGFVEVISNGETVELGFASAFSGLTGQSALRNDVGAKAVAGFTQSACDITPLMFCVPDSTWRADDHKGVSVLLRTGGNGAGWGPGAFGFIDPSAGLSASAGACANLSGAQLDICLIAAVNDRSACFDSSGVSVRTGQSVGVFEAALNVRFDIFLASTLSLRNNPNYAPAPNVIKGYAAASVSPDSGGVAPGGVNPDGAGSQCVAETGDISINTVGLSPDDCHLLGTCGRFGNGDWQVARAAYVLTNYGGVDPHPQAETRYDYYMAEIAASGGPAATQNILNGRAETGRPQCSAHQSTNPKRRNLIAAGIDCSSVTLTVGGASSVPILEFVELFMIKPLGMDGTRDFWVEVVGSAGGGSGGTGDSSVFRDVVRLYK